MPGELVTQPEARPALAGPSPLALLEQAIAKGMDPEKLGRLMDLVERWKANQAAEEFARAISAFQAEVPVVVKARTAKIVGERGQFEYQFASLDDVMKIAAPILARHAIAVSFRTEQIPNGLRVWCRVRVGIHVEETAVEIPIPAMKVNDAQRFGAALSYAKRYSLCAALNIVVTDEDDDGATAFEPITEKQVAEIKALIAANKVNEKRYLEWVQVGRVEEIAKGGFAKALDALRRWGSGAGK